MNQEKSLSDVGVWQKELGLLPVPLYPVYPSKSEGQPFVLLNGTRGNFCLDVQGEKQEKTRSIAWSSNVSHYVSVRKDYVEVQRWDQSRSSLARYSTGSVRDNLEKFHDYLEKDAPSQDLSIVSHAIRVFRSLRAVLGSKYTGPEALRAFLCLLACAKDQVERDSLVLEDWALASQSAEVAGVISDSSWRALRDDLLYGRRLEDLESNLTLLLRHAAGQLFQEAHYEAVFVPQSQLQLAGFTPTPVNISKETTSIGLHFTPPALARSLVEEALNPIDGSLTIFDPACGSGEFLRESVRQLELRGYSGRVNIKGWDISQAACDMAQFVLAWEKRNTEADIETEVRCVDSLNPDEVWPSQVTNVFMNPPFVSWQDMTKNQREVVADVLQDVKEKKPDLSHAFLLKASLCLSQNGVLGAILPSSILDGDSAQKLRHQLSIYVSPKLLARLGSQYLFPGAMIDAAFYIAQKSMDAQGATVAFWANHRSSSNSAGLRALRRLRYAPSSSAYPLLGDGYNIYLAELGRDGGNWSPRPYDAWVVTQRLIHLPRLEELFKVVQGVRTGDKSSFVVSKAEWAALPKREQNYFRPAVLNRSINKGVLSDKFYIFYPHGKKIFNNETELAEFLPVYYTNYLLPSKGKLQGRARVKPETWWNLSEHRPRLVGRVPKLVTTYFGDAGSFAYDSTGDYVVVQGHAWLPKPAGLAQKFVEGDNSLPKRLKENAVLPDGLAYAYLAIINSNLFSTLLSASSNSVAGGQWNLSKKFVDSVAMPNLMENQVSSDLVPDLAKVGEQIARGTHVDKESQEELVRLIYGLSANT